MASRLPFHRLSGQHLRTLHRNNSVSRSLHIGRARSLTSVALQKSVNGSLKSSASLQQVTALGSVASSLFLINGNQRLTVVTGPKCLASVSLLSGLLRCGLMVKFPSIVSKRYSTKACCCFRLADTVVKVPQMAESITEGTLKQFSKREVPALEAYIDRANIVGQRSVTTLNGTRRSQPLRLTR